MNPNNNVAQGNDTSGKKSPSKVQPEDPCLRHYAIPGSELSLTNNRVVQDFTITTDSYVLLSNHLYQALCSENAEFADRVSESAFQYYAVMLLWQRLSQFLSPQSRRASPFLESLSSLDQYLTGVPKSLEIYLRGIGNFKHPYFGEMRFRLPEALLSERFNLVDGTFGKVTADTHFLYEAFPAPGIAALRILNDVGEKYLDHPVWDLPKDLRPDFEDYSGAEDRANSALARPRPTRNLLGWAPAQRLTAKQFKLFQESAIESNDPVNDLPTFFKNSHKLLAAVGAYFDGVKNPFTKNLITLQQIGKTPGKFYTLTNNSNGCTMSPTPPTKNPLDKNPVAFFGSTNQSKTPDQSPPVIFESAETGRPVKLLKSASTASNNGNSSTTNSPKNVFKASTSSPFSAGAKAFAERIPRVDETSAQPFTFSNVQVSSKATSVSPEPQLQPESEKPDSDFFRVFDRFSKVKRLPFDGSAIQGLVVKRVAEPLAFDRCRMYCDGRVSVHSSWKVNDILTTGAVVAGYRTPKEPIHNRHSWCCYDFNDYERVPESWVSTRNSIYTFKDNIEGINIPMWSTGITEKKITQYSFLEKHLTVSRNMWNTYM